MRLLSAGKSWVSGKDEAVRYQMGDPRGLPKFGSGKNPFRSSTKSGAIGTSPIESAPSVQPVTAEQPDKVGARTAPVRRSPDRKATPALLPERCQHSGPVRAGTVRAPNEQVVGGLGTWWEKLSALVPRNRRGPVRTKAARAAKPAVQGELSLEKIKVMRNDLSDTDLEIVSAKKAPTSAKPIPAQQSQEISEQETGVRFVGEQNANAVGRS